jgi:hypothetical protein
VALALVAALWPRTTNMPSSTGLFSSLVAVDGWTLLPAFAAAVLAPVLFARSINRAGDQP